MNLRVTDSIEIHIMYKQTNAITYARNDPICEIYIVAIRYIVYKKDILK
jgi:hypothetical protein